MAKIAFDIAKTKGYRYEPETGIVYGVKGQPIKRNINGYINIVVKSEGKVYQIYGHQYAFYITHGYVPKCIDHINQDKSDNRIGNLRDIPKKQNHYNMKTKGYSYDKGMSKWHSYINKDGIRTNLGYYETESDAKQAYLSAKKEIHIYG